MSFLHGIEVVELSGGPRPIETSKSSVIGLVGTALQGPVNIPTLIAGSRKEAVKIFGEDDGKCTIPYALDAIFDQIGAAVVVINVLPPATDPEAVTMSQIAGGVDAVTGNYTGVQALVAAESVVHVSPRLLIAPGFTCKVDTVNSTPTNTVFDSGQKNVVENLLAVAERLRAIAIIDGPNTNDANAISYRMLFDNPRLFMVDPYVKVFSSVTEQDVSQPSSARVAGILAKSDNQRGFWYSPSNRPIDGITGTERPIDFTMGDINARANMLNESNVATIIHQDGYRLWGNRTCCSDNKWMFVSVRRTADMINDALMRCHLWAVDENITASYLESVTRGVNNFLRHLKSIGAIIGGECWADPEINTPDQIQLGKIVFDFDFTPPYPAERLTFRSRLVNNYLKEIL